MRLRASVLAGLLIVLAVTLARALISHDGVGVFEYVVGGALLAALLVGAVRFSHRAIASG